MFKNRKKSFRIIWLKDATYFIGEELNEKKVLKQKWFEMEK